MINRQHHYQVTVQWTGNKGSGTSAYKAYARDHMINAEHKPSIQGSSDPAFLGDPTRWNPEELLLASVSACHQLWYLHLCADAGIVVISYADEAKGTMVEDPRGHFTDIVLHPHITIRPEDDIELATQLHHLAHEKCFVANSLNFPVRCEPVIRTAAM
ncbi:OsmC family protein [Hydrogenophaga soli]